MHLRTPDFREPTTLLTHAQKYKEHTTRIIMSKHVKKVILNFFLVDFSKFHFLGFSKHSRLIQHILLEQQDPSWLFPN
ncbi:hypothetical protein AQUCO_00700895v1 [Aquilegia coerulea]|uniref:Uncharacterized protein n=1 Tax=Aquilegia coerulea TaxID=218851 RepID=A0A2G5EM90_AQUCA|nr:hypothetical protein AQUCO_00700895v1 [Aquilegia coerulea]